MGFQHSGIGDDMYNDKTGYMGFAINRLGMPLKAFVSLLIAITYPLPSERDADSN